MPAVIAGDFNTYRSPMNQETIDDTILISSIFENAKLNIHHVSNDLFTFRTSYGQSQFDQFYVSDSLSVSPLQVFNICNKETTTGEGLGDLAYYNNNISDHCPVSAEISL